MAEEEQWLTRAGFHWFENASLCARISARQIALIAAAWVRRFERFWATPTSFFLFAPELLRDDQMPAAVDFLDRWADGTTGLHDWFEAVKNAREAAHFARVLHEDLVEDNDEGVMQFRAAGTDSAAKAVEFVCELMVVCGTPERKLADALVPFGTYTAPSVPAFVTDRERRPPQFSSPHQRVLDQLASVFRDLSQVAADAAGWRSEDQNRVYDAESQAELVLMHEVFGNPFRQVGFAPEWRTSTAIALARQMYDSCDFSAMSILADALQDAGCDHPDILAHCRDPQQVHVRGCWAIDLVLGKE